MRLIVCALVCALSLFAFAPSMPALADSCGNTNAVVAGGMPTLYGAPSGYAIRSVCIVQANGHATTLTNTTKVGQQIIGGCFDYYNNGSDVIISYGRHWKPACSAISVVRILTTKQYRVFGSAD